MEVDFNLKRAIAWTAGVLFILFSLAFFPETIVGGLILLVAGVFLIPVVRDELGVTVPAGVLVMIALVAFISAAMVLPPQDTTNGASTDSVPSEPDTDDASSEIDSEDEERDDTDDTEEPEPGRLDAEGELEIHFFDVGQADATLLDGPDFNVLVDAGHWQRNDVVPHLRNEGIEELDLMILTHPHADHIGQADIVLEELEVREVWMSGDTHTTQTFGRVVDAIEASDAGYHEPRAGEVFEVGSLRIEILHPKELTGDLHEGNIAVRALFGDTRVVLTGDSEAREEGLMVRRDLDLDAQIYQLGHHGSSTSSTREFLEEMNPEVGVYSAAEDSQYGHPHDEVVERFNRMGIDLYGTGEHGTVAIVADADGEYEIETEVDAPLVTPGLSVPVGPVGAGGGVEVVAP